jgi:hypothetical protein
MDDGLLGEIDRAASVLGENRSAVMRMAMRAGLPLIIAQWEKVASTQGSGDAISEILFAPISPAVEKLINARLQEWWDAHLDEIDQTARHAARGGGKLPQPAATSGASPKPKRPPSGPKPAQ